jgi:hypothetical protein
MARLKGHPDPGKEISRCFFINPSVNFDFVAPAQFPNLVFDLFGIHNGFFSFQSRALPDKYRLGRFCQRRI